MIPLMLHHICDLGPIKAVLARIEPTQTGFEASFRIEGRVSGIVVPEPAPSVRADELWKTTCFEVFWQPIGTTRYHEFNLSPSGQWAAYEFDSYREGMREASVDAIAVSRSPAEADSSAMIEITASIAAELSDPAQVGLTAVIEHRDGGLQYWSLAFGPGKPDFHSEACRQLIIER